MPGARGAKSDRAEESNAMMRLRRVSVIGALFLLAWTATASAECAWVLWIEEETTTKKDSGGRFTSSPEWKALQAEPNAPGCVKALTDLVVKIESTAKPVFGATANVSRSGGRATVQLTYPESEPFWVKRLFTYTCLPDTVDPRGPKSNSTSR
jgi:hypothetical protein